jgi:acetyltransferase
MWTLRPAEPADLEALQDFVAALSVATRVQRFFIPLRGLPAALATALVQRDPSHRFVVAEHAGAPIALGQLAIVADGARAEIALVVADGWQRRGVGTGLLACLHSEAKRRGLRELVIETLAGNRGMLALARRAGFELRAHPDDAGLRLGRRLLAT